ncbi:MAG: AzlC family ABC transporter permease [Ruminococcus sp.]|jgi:predicted branched-subunit amino acid permease
MNEWKQGVRDGLPICFGYFAVSFAFGIQAGDVGMTPFQAVLMSVTNLTSAGQLASLGTIAAQASYLEMAFLQFVINMRYFLMSCALSQKIQENTKSVHRFAMAYGVTDEIFGVSVVRPGDLSPWYSYGLMSVAVPGWALGTLAGVVSGDILPPAVINALGIAIYGMFIAVVLPAAKQDKAVMGVAAAAMVLSCLFYYAPVLKQVSSGMQVIIITLAVAGAAAWLFPRKEEAEA